MEPPETAFRIELSGPDGERWNWGSRRRTASGVVRGPALDFCLLVTQRREPEDLGLETEGTTPGSGCLAQVFAGPPKKIMRAR